MRLIDADALKKVIFSKTDSMEDLWDTAGVLNAINNAPTVPLPDFKEGYKQAIIDGKTNFSRPKPDPKKLSPYHDTYRDALFDEALDELERKERGSAE